MLSPLSTRVFCGPQAASRRPRSTTGVQDTVTLSQARPARKASGGALRQLGLVVGLALAVKFAGPLAYSLDPIRPDPSQVSVQVEQQSGTTCQPHGPVVAGTPDERARMGQVEQTLQRYSNRPEVDYRFQMSRMEQPNAESCPAGLIGIDEQVVGELDSQELLFVMAHEQGHVEARDHVRQEAFLHQAIAREFKPISWLPGYRRAMQNDLLEQAREAETRADCYALGVLRAEGVSPEKAASALTKVEHMVEQRTGRAPTSGNADHPATTQRIQHLLNGCSD